MTIEQAADLLELTQSLIDTVSIVGRILCVFLGAFLFSVVQSAFKV
jgi:hypothetical protein